jgi:hypothetical protein
VLKKCFDGFCQDGSIHVDTIGTIFTMMGLRVKPSALREIIEEVSGKTPCSQSCAVDSVPMVWLDEGQSFYANIQINVITLIKKKHIKNKIIMIPKIVLTALIKTSYTKESYYHSNHMSQS